MNRCHCSLFFLCVRLLEGGGKKRRRIRRFTDRKKQLEFSKMELCVIFP